MASKVKIKFSEKRNDVILVQDRISNSAKHSLRPGLRARRLTPYSVGVRPIPSGAVAINFGGLQLPPALGGRKDIVVLNPPDKIALSANKLRTFELLKEANVQSVRWTVQRAAAEEWIKKGHKVMGRVSLSSSGGRGIRVAETVESLVGAPLYTRYFPKTHEFRVHVVAGEAIDLTEKKLRNELREKREDVSTIRNHDNGWVHAHDDLDLSDPGDLAAIRKLGVDAIAAVGLDFGAVDILATLSDATPRRLNRAVVCEVNAAPGIENTATRAAYVAGLNKLITARKGA